MRVLGCLIASAGLTIIEWADRVPDALPDDHLRIEIEVLGPTARRFRVRWIGDQSHSPLERLTEALH